MSQRRCTRARVIRDRRLWTLAQAASCMDHGVDPAGTTAAVDLNPQTDETINEMTDNMRDHDAKLRFLAANFDPLPKKMVDISQDSSIYAQYAQPTDRYGHGILGDAIEAGQLVRRRTDARSPLSSSRVPGP